jgi:heptosyltransferase-1
MRVLLIKLSSMGDVIHTLPAINDAAQAIPGIKFTWLIEEGFQEIAAWHPAVERVIPIAIRKRKYAEILTSLKQLRAQKFDLILDAQGLIKSAILSSLASGKLRAGYDRNSSRESIASMFYSRGCKVAKDQHAVDRLRQLFAQALGYALPQHIADYGIVWPRVDSYSTTQPYLMFLHGTTWDSKHWPDEYWLQLAHLVSTHGYGVQVTWATPQQKQRAEFLAANATNVTMLPHLTINQAAQVLHHAHGVVAVDTGFAHLAAALAKPTVAVYGPTDIVKAGTVGKSSINLASKFGCAPCGRRICNFVGEKSVNPPCFAEITPQAVWATLATIL